MGDELEKATVSNRLDTTPCAFVANQYGWTGNMQKIMSAQAYAKSGDSNNKFYKEQKKILEINPRHPIVKQLLTKVSEAAEIEDEEAKTAATDGIKDTVMVLLDTPAPVRVRAHGPGRFRGPNGEAAPPKPSS